VAQIRLRSKSRLPTCSSIWGKVAQGSNGTEDLALLPHFHIRWRNTYSPGSVRSAIDLSRRGKGLAWRLIRASSQYKRQSFDSRTRALYSSLLALAILFNPPPCSSPVAIRHGYDRSIVRPSRGGEECSHAGSTDTLLVRRDPLSNPMRSHAPKLVLQRSSLANQQQLVGSSC
jgi:hypothetical protein